MPDKKVIITALVVTCVVIIASNKVAFVNKALNLKFGA